MTRLRPFLVLGLTALATTAVAAATKATFHVAKKIAVPGKGTYYDYLYVDPAAHTLYVSFGDQVAILDADKDAVDGTLGGFKKVHGIAVGAGRIFVTDGGSDEVRIFDQKTRKAAGRVPAGKNPDAVLFDPVTAQVFAFNHTGGTATVIDAATSKVAGTIAIGGALEFGRADGKGTVWVNVEDKSELVRIDARTRAVTAHWPLAPCEEPTGLAFDDKNRRLFVGCGNSKMAVVDADSGKVLTTLPIGPGVDATDFDPATRNIFNSCGGDGTLSVIHQESANGYKPVATVPTQKRAKTLALDPRTHRVFLSAAAFGAPPDAAADQKPGRPPMVPGTFTVLVVEP